MCCIKIKVGIIHKSLNETLNNPLKVFISELVYLSKTTIGLHYGIILYLGLFKSDFLHFSTVSKFNLTLIKKIIVFEDRESVMWTS